MSLCITGLDHTSCPLRIREIAMLNPSEGGRIAQELVSATGIQEALVISTCARTEVYIWAEMGSEHSALKRARRRLSETSHQMPPYLKDLVGQEAVRHAFRVSAGLESQVFGETEIAGQVRSALKQAQSDGTLGKKLRRLFVAAMACSRRLRSETSVGALDTSVAHAARELFAADHNIEGIRVLIVGTGKIARLVAEEFQGAREVVATSRSGVREPMRLFPPGVSSLDFKVAMRGVSEFDLVICATRASRPILTAADLPGSEPITLIDLAVPRNIDSSVAALSHVTLYDVDDVRPPTSNQLDATMIESILESETRELQAQESLEQVAPVIASLRAHVDRVQVEELERLRHQLERMAPSERGVIETLTHRLIDRMFHHLVIRLRLAALTDPELVKAADFFFAHGNDSIFPSPLDQDEAAGARELIGTT